MKNLKTLLIAVLIYPIILMGLILTRQLFYECGNSDIEHSLLLLISAPLSLFLTIKYIQTKIKFSYMIFIILGIYLISLLFLSTTNHENRSASISAQTKQKMSNARSMSEKFYQNQGYSYEELCNSSRVVELRESIFDIQSKYTNKCLGPITDLFFNDATPKLHFECKSTTDEYKMEAYIPVLEKNWCVSTNYVGVCEEK